MVTYVGLDTNRIVSKERINTIRESDELALQAEQGNSKTTSYYNDSPMKIINPTHTTKYTENPKYFDTKQQYLLTGGGKSVEKKIPVYRDQNNKFSRNNKKQ
jgi:hypothetical protein